MYNVGQEQQETGYGSVRIDETEPQISEPGAGEPGQTSGVPVESPEWDSTGQAGESSAEEAEGMPMEGPAENPAGGAEEAPIGGPAENPAGGIEGTPTESSFEMPAETPTEDQTESPTEDITGKDEILEFDRMPLQKQIDPFYKKYKAPLLCAAAITVILAATLMVLSAQRKRQKRKNRRAKESRQRQIQRIEPTERNRNDMQLQNARKRSGRNAGVEEIGEVHNIGARTQQQDCYGVIEINNVIMAVVADGMGGLSDGDKVSGKIVGIMLQDAKKLQAENMEALPLYQMVCHVNQEVNYMLGASGLYKSGSTLIAVLAEKERFWWVSIGDSRIYLFRGKRLVQLNQEHVYLTELLGKAANSEISFADAMTDRQKNRLTSFIGMGKLKHIDGSLHPLELQPKDRILLMSDGVFNTLSDAEISQVLMQSPNARDAAALLEQRVLMKKNPRQDNFTAVILEF